MRAAVLCFGRWMLEHFAGEKWTPEFGREKWAVWCTRQEKFVANTVAVENRPQANQKEHD